MLINTIKNIMVAKIFKHDHIIFSLIPIILILTSCNIIIPEKDLQSNLDEKSVFKLKNTNSKECIGLLSKFEYNKISEIPDTNSIITTGTFEQLHKLDILIDLIDDNKMYFVENLGPASVARILPPNNQIAQFLGDDVAIGTFLNPPSRNTNERGIIDIHNDVVMGVLPVAYREKLHKLLFNTDDEKELA